MRKSFLVAFSVLSLGIYAWMDSFIRVYPSFLPWLLQTFLVCFLVCQVSKSKLSLVQSGIVASLIGWVVSIVVHNVFAFIYYDRFILSIKEHYQVGLIFQHLWFMCWSSLLTLGFIQALALMLLLKLSNSRR